jgi:hypothetical protein
VSREVRAYEPTWLDREYRKSLAKLDADAQARAESDLARLIGALQKCRHPSKDPDLAAWRPSPYSGLGIDGLYEYRLGALSRVIARCRNVAADGPILLVAATLSHDHPRIKRLLDEHKKRIKSL